jgi:hypothetical protein
MVTSICSALRTGAASVVILKPAAADWIARMKNFDCGDVSGLTIMVTRVITGDICFNKSSHFEPIENSYAEKPVALPPGLVTLSTKPCATGSET